MTAVYLLDNMLPDIKLITLDEMALAYVDGEGRGEGYREESTTI